MFFFLLIIAIGANHSFDIELHNLGYVALSGLIGIGIGDCLYYSSLNRLSPVMVSVIFLLGPFFYGILGMFFLNEIPSNLSLLGIIIIIIGLALLTIKPENNSNTAIFKTKFSGLLMAILSLVCTSYSMVLIKPVLEKNSPLVVTVYRMLISFIVLFIFSVFTKRLPVWKQTFSDIHYSIKYILVTAIVAIGGYWFALESMKRCELVISSSIMSMQPLFVLFIMTLIYKYRPKLKEYFGIVIVITGAILLCL